MGSVTVCSDTVGSDMGSDTVGSDMGSGIVLLTFCTCNNCVDAFIGDFVEVSIIKSLSLSIFTDFVAFSRDNVISVLFANVCCDCAIFASRCIFCFCIIRLSILNKLCFF